MSGVGVGGWSSSGGEECRGVESVFMIKLKLVEKIFEISYSPSELFLGISTNHRNSLRFSLRAARSP